MRQESVSAPAQPGDGTRPPGPRFPAWLALVLITPLVAELLAGSTPLGEPAIAGTLLVVYLPLYGAGALLIRELTVRAGRG
jgi:hypothetical protein